MPNVGSPFLQGGFGSWPKTNGVAKKKLARKKAKLPSANGKSAACLTVAWKVNPPTRARADSGGSRDGKHVRRRDGTGVIARELPNGKVALAVFLLDLSCLGIKDAFAIGASEFESRPDAAVQPKNGSQSRVAFVFEEARPRTGSVVAEHRFRAHADHREAKPLLEGINADECDEQFTFGKGGKPMYINGPRDTPVKIRRVLETLKRTCGERGFDHVLWSATSTTLRAGVRIAHE